MSFLCLLFILSFPLTTVFAQTQTINPSSGIFLSEFLPDPDSGNEWVEIFNQNNYEAVLEGWKIKDDTDTIKKLDTTIPAKSFYVLEVGSRYLNNDKDSVNLINHLSDTIETVSYNSSQKGVSWSKQSDGSWCQTNPTKGVLNNTCLTSPTNTPTNIPIPSNTPTNSPPQIRLEVVDTPNSVKTADSFSIKISLKNAPKDSSFSFKPFDKLNASKNYFTYQCKDTKKWCYFGSGFSDIPSFSTNQNGELSATLILKFDPKKDIPDEYISQVAVKTKSNLSDDWVDSINIKIVEVIKPETIPSPTSTLKPTTTPTLSITPSPTDTITDTPTPQTPPEVLGDYDDISETISFVSPTATPSSTNSANLFNFAPYFLIFSGGGLLLTPALITKFKK